MDKKRRAAFKYAEKVLREIAAKNEYPPPPSPINFDAIQQGWRKMVTTARKAVAKLDATKDAD